MENENYTDNFKFPFPNENGFLKDTPKYFENLSKAIDTTLKKVSDDKLDSKNKATSEETIAGTDDTKYTTPATVKSAIDKAIKETPPSSTKIIQENGVATTDNVYSAVAVNKKIDNLDVIDITDKYTTYFTKTLFKAFYYKKTHIVEIIYRFTGISGSQWVNMAVLNDTSYKPSSGHEDTAYGSAAQIAFVQINGSGNLQIFRETGTDMASGSIRYVVNEV